jgi:hypothetical protein
VGHTAALGANDLHFFHFLHFFHSQRRRYIAGLEPCRPTHTRSLASQYRTGGDLGPVTAAVIEPPAYDPLVEMSRVSWAKLEAAPGPGCGPSPACGPCRP